MSETGVPKKSGAMPWLIGCGLAILLVILALSGFGYYLFKTSMFLEPKETAALAAEIAPGAKAPEGYTPVWGMHLFGMKMVVFGPPGMMDAGKSPAVTRFVVASTDKGRLPGRAMRESAFGGKSKIADEEVREAGVETIKVGTTEYRLRKSRFEQDGAMNLGFELDLGERDGAHRKIMFLGPEKSFDRAAMAAFLGSLAPDAVAPGTPAPDAAGKAEKDDGAGGEPPTPKGGTSGKDAGKDKGK